MKVLTALTILQIALTCNLNGQCVVHARVGNLPDNTKVFLIGEDWRDSAIVHNGNFVFNIPSLAGKNYSLRLNRQYLPGTWRDFYFDKGVVKITSSKGILADARLSGPPNIQDLDNYYLTVSNSYFKQLVANEKKMNMALEIRDTIGAKKLYKQYKKIDSLKIRKAGEWIAKHPNSVIAAYLLYQDLRYSISKSQLEDLLNGLSDNVRNDPYGLKLANIIEAAKVTAIGKSAPDFLQNDTAGNPISLKNFIGKYILVDFWASWCVPCRAENPNLVKAYEKYHSRGFEIVSVSLDSDREKWLQAIKQDNLAWTHVSDLKYWDNQIAKQYDIHSVPFNLLLDRAGKIIAKNLRDEKLARTLGDIFQ